MASTTTKSPYKSSKRRKAKSQPVTSGSNPGTPGPSMSVNLNRSLGYDDSNIKSGSGPDPAPIDVTSQHTSSSSSSSRLQSREPESGSTLNVIDTSVLSSPSSTPTPIAQSKSTAKEFAATPSPVPQPPPLSTSMPKNLGPAVPAPFGVGEEFIAFAFSDSDEETAAIPVREWDQGKQGRDVEMREKKRKHGELSRDDRESGRDGRRERGRDREQDRIGDRYGEKRQQMGGVPRHTPWIANVDWDRCTNVAEL